MKYLKLIGLAAIAAMALAAFGAGTASAYTLCPETPAAGTNSCPTVKAGVSQHYSTGTAFTGTSSSAVLTVEGSFAVSTVTCTENSVGLKSTSTGTDNDEAINGEVTSVKFGACKTNSGVGCTVSESKGYTGTIVGTTPGNGTMTVKGAGIKTTVVCGSIFSCEYEPTSAGIDLAMTGGHPTTATATSQPLTHVGAGFGCGTGAKWDATYSLTGTTSTVSVTTNDV